MGGPTGEFRQSRGRVIDVVGRQERNHGARRFDQTASQPCPVVHRAEVGEERIVHRQAVFGRGHLPESDEFDAAGRCLTQHRVRVRQRIAAELATDTAVGEVLVPVGRRGGPGACGDGDGGRVREFAAELRHLNEPVGRELQGGGQRDRVSRGAVGPALGHHLGGDQHVRRDAGQVDFVDDRHVERDAVADQHRVVLSGHYPDDSPATPVGHRQRAGRRFEIGVRVDGDHYRLIARRLREGMQRNMASHSVSGATRGTGVGPAQTAHGSARRRRGRHRGGRGIDRSQRRDHQFLGAHPRIDLDPVQECRGALQGLQRSFTSSGGCMAVSLRGDRSVVHARQHEFGGVIADVDAGDDRTATGRHRSRPLRV